MKWDGMEWELMANKLPSVFTLFHSLPPHLTLSHSITLFFTHLHSPNLTAYWGLSNFLQENSL